MPILSVTLTTDTLVYASGDVLADTQLVLANLFKPGQEAVLDSISIEDDDDQGIAFDLVFLKSNTPLGTENAAPNISDANFALAVIGQVVIAAGDFVDYGGVRQANKYNLGIPLQLTPIAKDLYIGAISRGAGTYTANGLKLKLGIRFRPVN